MPLNNPNKKVKFKENCKLNDKDTNLLNSKDMVDCFNHYIQQLYRQNDRNDYSMGKLFNKTTLKWFMRRSIRFNTNEEPKSHVKKEFYLMMSKLMNSLIMKNIGSQFFQLRTVHESIEKVEESILKDMDSVVAILKKLSITILNSCESCDNSFTERILEKLNQFVYYNSPKNLLWVTKFLKKRDFKEMIGRKRKGQLSKVIRNDQRQKKVFKLILMNMRKKVISQEVLKMGGPKLVESRNCFTPNNSELPDELFLKHYFQTTAEKMGVELSMFSDPTRHKNSNPKFKCFNNFYFNLTLSSNLFKQEVSDLISSDGLYKNVICGYPQLLEETLCKSPTSFVSQYKKKAKFLWTAYQLYFALKFFEDKFSLY